MSPSDIISAVRRPLNLAVCVLVAPAAIAAGCGSSETASTITQASAPAPTTAATTTPQAATASTGATAASTGAKARSTGATGATKAKKALTPVPILTPKPHESTSEAERKRKVKAALEATLKNPKRLAEAKREVERRAKEELEARETAGRNGPGFNKAVSLKRRFPPEITQPFYRQCETSKGTVAVCECIIVKLELAKGEREKSIAELVAVEVALKQGVSLKKLRSALLPPNARGAVRACVS